MPADLTLYRAPIDFRKQVRHSAALGRAAKLGTTRHRCPLCLYQSPPQQDQGLDVGGDNGFEALLQGAGRGEIQVAIVCR